MFPTLHRFALIVAIVTAVVAAPAANNGRDLGKAPPVGVSSERLKRLDAGLQRFVEENRLAFVGMIQHRGRANSEIRAISRNLVYQALVN